MAPDQPVSRPHCSGSSGCPDSPAPRAARRCQAPAANSSFPAFASPQEKPPGWCPFPAVKTFLRPSPASRKSLSQFILKFFPVHILSTESRWLSARHGGYPPPYAQLLHRSPDVTPRIPAMTTHRNHSVFSRRPSVKPEFPAAPPRRPPRPPLPSSPLPSLLPRPAPSRAPPIQTRQRNPARLAASIRHGCRSHAAGGALRLIIRAAPPPAEIPGKYDCPVSAIGLPWIYDLSPGAEATRIHESGAAAFGCPGQRSGCLVNASRHSPAAAQGKSLRAVFIYFRPN